MNIHYITYVYNQYVFLTQCLTWILFLVDNKALKEDI